MVGAVGVVWVVVTVWVIAGWVVMVVVVVAGWVVMVVVTVWVVAG